MRAGWDAALPAGVCVAPTGAVPAGALVYRADGAAGWMASRLWRRDSEAPASDAWRIGDGARSVQAWLFSGSGSGDSSSGAGGCGAHGGDTSGVRVGHAVAATDARDAPAVVAVVACSAGDAPAPRAALLHAVRRQLARARTVVLGAWLPVRMFDRPCAIALLPRDAPAASVHACASALVDVDADSASCATAVVWSDSVDVCLRPALAAGSPVHEALRRVDAFVFRLAWPHVDPHAVLALQPTLRRDLQEALGAAASGAAGVLARTRPVVLMCGEERFGAALLLRAWACANAIAAVELPAASLVASERSHALVRYRTRAVLADQTLLVVTDAEMLDQASCAVVRDLLSSEHRVCGAVLATRDADDVPSCARSLYSRVVNATSVGRDRLVAFLAGDLPDGGLKDVAQRLCEAGALGVGGAVRARTYMHALAREADPAAAALALDPRSMSFGISRGGSSTFASVPPGRWDDVAGYGSVKAALVESVIRPLQHAATFDRFGVPPVGGVLLYGPRGNSQDALVSALVHELQWNSLAVPASALLSPYFGESEKQLRSVFAEARRLAPCVLYLADLDALCPRRDSLGDSTGTTERVVATLLTELDGVSARNGVLVVGTSSSIEAVDAAAVRPGRLELHVGVANPSFEDRVAFFERELPSAVQGTVAAVQCATATAGSRLSELRRLVVSVVRCAVCSQRSDPTLEDVRVALEQRREAMVGAAFAT